MDPVLVLDEPSLQVEPGGEARASVTVSGGGTDVERYRLEVVGDAARWAQLTPRHVTVPPDGSEQTVELVFRPPHANAAPSRVVPFGVRALSLQDRERSAVVEGDLVVTPVRDVQARIEPVAAAGRWGAGYRVRLANSGSWPGTVRVTGSDGTGALRFAVAPVNATVPSGGNATVLVAVRVRRPRLVGRPVRHSFGVEYRGEGATSSGRLPAVLEQRAVLPAVVAALLALVVVAVVSAAVLLWLLPTLRTGPVAAPTGPPTAPGSAAVPPSPQQDPVSGFVVIYGPPTPVDDTANKQAAAEFAARLQAAGVDARVVDSRDSDQLDDGLKGLLVVVRDGFPNRAAAQAECSARREIAPSCVVVAPR